MNTQMEIIHLAYKGQTINAKLLNNKDLTEIVTLAKYFSKLKTYDQNINKFRGFEDVITNEPTQDTEGSLMIVLSDVGKKIIDDIEPNNPFNSYHKDIGFVVGIQYISKNFHTLTPINAKNDEIFLNSLYAKNQKNISIENEALYTNNNGILSLTNSGAKFVKDYLTNANRINNAIINTFQSEIKEIDETYSWMRKPDEEIFLKESKNNKTSLLQDNTFEDGTDEQILGLADDLEIPVDQYVKNPFKKDSYDLVMYNNTN